MVVGAGVEEGVEEVEAGVVEVEAGVVEQVRHRSAARLVLSPNSLPG